MDPHTDQPDDRVIDTEGVHLSQTIDPLGDLAALQPMIEHLRRTHGRLAGRPVAAYAVGANRQSGEVYLFGTDAAGRDFALRFTVEEAAALMAKLGDQIRTANGEF